METKKLHIKGYELVVANIDGMRENIVAYTEDKEVATKFNEQSAWHSFRPVDKNFVFHFIDSLDELELIRVEEQRERALAKLTPEEKKLLGLS